MDHKSAIIALTLAVTAPVAATAHATTATEPAAPAIEHAAPQASEAPGAAPVEPPAAHPGTGQSAYQPKSSFLTDPEAARDFVIRSANFWVDKAYDRDLGGFYADVSRDGSLRLPLRKSAMHQSRNAYAMTRAFMLTGDERYLEYARGALDFMYTHSWDKTNGGWFAMHTPAGGVTTSSLNSRKDAFYQHYALLGIAAAVEAENRGTDWEWLRRGYGSLTAGLWDSRPGFEGYFHTAGTDWSNPTGKSFNATVDALTTHALALHHLTGEPAHEEKVVELADQIMNRLVAAGDGPGVAFGFPQDYDSDWNVLSGTDAQRRVYVGHVLKTAWCLLRANAIRPNPEYVDAARRLIHEVYTFDAGTPNAAYDHVNGGPMSNFYWDTGKMRVTQAQPPQKLWWELEQAYMAGIMQWHATGDPVSLRMADESIDFFARHFEDPVHGEVFDTVRPDGTPLVLTKASTNKAGYHTAETGYLAYLYSSLLYHGKPATLHYRFVAKDQVQKIRLTPIEIEDKKLRIRSVTLNGEPFCTVNRVQRELVLPPGVGGVFAVTFEVAEPAGQHVADVNSCASTVPSAAP